MNKKAIASAVLGLLGSVSAAQACETCVLTGINGHTAQPASGGGVVLSSPPLGMSTPAYSSRPGAAAQLFLDLDGINYEGTWAGKTPGNVPAYDTDGDPSSFSEVELENIHQIYTRVAEAYSPFEVNVTTVDPGDFTQIRLNTRVIIGGSNAWYNTGAGGVAYVGGYPYGPGSVEWRTGWAFPDNLGAGNPKYVADATIHEAGHQFGLSHQAAFNPDGTYAAGYRQSTDGGLTAPNMGVAYSAVRGLWSDGPKAVNSGGVLVPVQQLDLDILSTTEYDTSGGYWNGFGFRADDWGNSGDTARAMVGVDDLLITSGVIEQSTDTDVFTFTSTGGDVSILVDGAEFGQMLDIVLNLYEADGDTPFYSDNPSLSLSAINGYGLDAAFDGFLAAGDYLLEVASNGNYGDIGQYFITASGAVSVPEPAAAGAVMLLGASVLLRRRRALV